MCGKERNIGISWPVDVRSQAVVVVYDVHDDFVFYKFAIDMRIVVKDGNRGYGTNNTKPTLLVGRAGYI